ncbi:MAG: CPBP family intramembrane metalloprotease [Clostridia bacterium]|nr:CPBP family intramembrane metalloprotease [Clostridia bacterium]
MNENNNIQNSNTTQTPQSTEKASGFDIRTMNSYRVYKDMESESPKQTQAPSIPSPFYAQSVNGGAYYTPSQPTQDEATAQKEFRRAARKRFSYVALSIVGMYFIYYFVAMIAMSVALALSGASELSTTASMIIGTLSLALVGFPVTFLLLLPKKSEPITEKGKMSFPKLLGFLATTFTAMYTGAFMGSTVSGILGVLLGKTSSEIVAGGLEGVPIYMVIIFTCIFPGIFEELIFRKLLIDKTRQFGNFGAVVFSSIAFGIFHGNFEQFFYATLIGFLFGYVYVRTGKIIYSMILHATINFFGSAFIMLIENNEIIMTIYGFVIVAVWVVGLIVFICDIVDNCSKLKLDKGIQAVGGNAIVKSAFLNVGSIVFLIVFAFEFVLVTLQTFGIIS